MIEELQDMPAGVTGIRVSGRVTADDFHQFKPTLDRMLASEEIRFVEVIGPDYEGFGPGGLLADVKQGFSTLKHLRAFKRTAVVTDKEWIAHALPALAWMIPGGLRSPVIFALKLVLAKPAFPVIAGRLSL